MKNSNKKVLWTLFSSVLKISACTFGGGFVIVPLMRKRFAQELGWIGEQEMLDLVSIAQSAPGPIAVNAAIMVGYRVAGVLGALIAALGTALPPLVIISGISAFYHTFRSSTVVSLLMKGMLCGVAAVILDVVVNMVAKLIKQKRALPLVILVGAFLAVRFFKVNILVIILLCALIGGIDTWAHRKAGGQA